MLVRAGRKISTETVRRYRKNPSRPAPAPDPDATRGEPVALRAKKSNHIWMTDITTIPSLFKLWSFKLVVILDVFSRFPLAFRIFWKEPESEEIAALVDEAATRHGAPRHFVTDRGSQFTGNAFVSKLHSLGIRQRFGAIGSSGSIAIIERFWRTLKEMLDVRFCSPLSLAHLEERIDRALFYYATLRPHQGLDGATPTEMYFGLTPPGREVSSARASRASPSSSDEPAVLPFEVTWLDPERRLPFLIPVTIAA